MRINLKKRKVEEDIEPVTITITIMPDDFEKTFKRKPIDQDEFVKFSDLCQVGIEVQLNWDNIKNSARTYMEYCRD